jgi:hypothetical protein
MTPGALENQVQHLREKMQEGRPHGSLSMKVTKNLGMLLLSIWLIVSGLIPVLNLSFSGLGTLMAIVSIAAGALIIVGR